MTDSQTFDLLNLEDDGEEEKESYDSDFPEVDWLKPIDDKPQSLTFADDKTNPIRIVITVIIGALLLLALMSRKEVHDSRLYYDGTNAVQVTKKRMSIFGFERYECNTNTDVKVVIDGKTIEVVGLTD